MRNNTRLFIYEGISVTIILNLVNPLFSMYAQRLGAGAYEIGLINALPSLVSISALIPGTFILSKYKDKKGITANLIFLFGIFYPIAALTPFMGRIGLYVFIAAISLMNWPFSLYNISWQSFFSDVICPNDRAIVYANRSRATSLFNIITLVFSGLFLTYVPQNDAQRIILYQILFVVSFLISLIQRYLLLQIKDYCIDACETNVGNSMTLKNYLSALSDGFKSYVTQKEFRYFSILIFFYNIAWQMGWPLFFIYQTKYLHANESLLSYVSAAVSLTGVVTYGFWAKMIKKYNTQLILIFGMSSLSINPFIIARQPSMTHLIILNSILGLTFSAFMLAQFERLMETVPPQLKTICIAIHTTLIGIAGFFSPLIGVSIYKVTSIRTSMDISSYFRLLILSIFIIRYLLWKKQQQSFTKKNDTYLN